MHGLLELEWSATLQRTESQSTKPARSVTALDGTSQSQDTQDAAYCAFASRRSRYSDHSSVWKKETTTYTTESTEQGNECRTLSCNKRSYTFACKNTDPPQTKGWDTKAFFVGNSSLHFTGFCGECKNSKKNACNPFRLIIDQQAQRTCPFAHAVNCLTPHYC